MIGGISVSPERHRLGFYFATEPDGFYSAEKVAEYLRDSLGNMKDHFQSLELLSWSEPFPQILPALHLSP